MQSVLSTYSFDSTMSLTLLQGLVTIICLETLRACGTSECGLRLATTHADADAATAGFLHYSHICTLPPSTFYLLPCS